MSLFNFFKRLVSPATPAPAPVAPSAPVASGGKSAPVAASKKAPAKRDHNQPIYDLIAERPVRRVIEFGAGLGDRAEKLLAAAAAHAPPTEIVYIGVDYFEAGPVPPGPGATLRDVYKRLKATQSAVKLLPGDLAGTLGHLALTTSNYDLIVVSLSFAEQNLEAGWAKLSRLLAPEGVLFVEERQDGKDAPVLKRLAAVEVARLAESSSGAKAAAPAKAAAVGAKPTAASTGEGRGPRPHFPPTGTTRADEPVAAATSTRKGSGRDPRSTANVKT
ncbi:MAG TPA: hypothetical protein VGE52_18940 [Pirellulales bacterium]